ncbi:LPXTG cell wall anchor domain-containing protein [Leucobacter coleopterorum]|uniref:LPXTG cell wall anchor domain-containing protein n=1 Tax=Leucobacter coleopterorum TaxID=2714933 RepID=A0ABX6JY18_9MICO|nr:LPXTG cell wall anchor domain-containing protein [Leucobacter coleopterorum]QIM19196.1 LPXTG cell wall anchor domain-containing protein [Leucobacter coleopterorum]
MKFVKHAAVLLAASAFVLTSGVSAANANSDASTGGETAISEATTPASRGSIWVDNNFKVVPSAEGFTMSFSYTSALWGTDSSLKLGVYAADAPQDVTAWNAEGVGAAAAFPGIEQAMADLTQEVKSQDLTFRKSVEKTVSFKPSGAYSVMLFEVSKDGARFLAGARVDVTPATPEVPSFDSKTFTLTVPESNEFTYRDSTGKIWAPGPHVIVAPVKLTAVPNPGFEAASEAPTEWPEFVPEVKPAPETNPEKEKGPNGSKDKSTETGKDKNTDEKTTTGGGTPPSSAPNENQLSPALEGKVGAQPTAVAGAQVKIFVGTQFAGKEVDVYVFSEPTYLGRHKVDSDGNVTVTLPAGLTGSHRLAVYDGGELIGWNRIIIGDSTDGSTGTGFVAGTVTTSRLAATGSETAGTFALLAAGSVVLGAASLLVRRRARRSVA